MSKALLQLVKNQSPAYVSANALLWILIGPFIMFTVHQQVAACTASQPYGTRRQMQTKCTQNAAHSMGKGATQQQVHAAAV